MKTQEGWKYLEQAAIQIVLEKNPVTARAIAQWFKDLVEAQLEETVNPPIPKNSRELVEGVLANGNRHGFVLGNYTTLADKILFLLEFEKLRKAKRSSKRRKTAS